MSAEPLAQMKSPAGEAIPLTGVHLSGSIEANLLELAVEQSYEVRRQGWCFFRSHLWISQIGSDVGGLGSRAPKPAGYVPNRLRCCVAYGLRRSRSSARTGYPSSTSCRMTCV